MAKKTQHKGQLIYPIHETFLTFQGEGAFIGVPALFIRSFGCPVQCPWCDAAGTWHPTWVPKDVARMSAEDLEKKVAEAQVPFVVITGGEPALFDWQPLIELLSEHEPPVNVHLETSGALPIKGGFDWVTLSPKRWKHPVQESIDRANEFKIIVEAPADIDYYTQLLLSYRVELGECPVWLHPEWSKRTDPVVLDAISERVKHGKGIYRAGWQIHKNYQVDLKDPNSRAPVPLGGDEGKGF